MELTYTKVGDYYIPDLTLGDQPDKALRKYGQMRQKFLEGHYPGTYNRLILSGKLWTHLVEIDITCDSLPSAAVLQAREDHARVGKQNRI